MPQEATQQCRTTFDIFRTGGRYPLLRPVAVDAGCKWLQSGAGDHRFEAQWFSNGDHDLSGLRAAPSRDLAPKLRSQFLNYDHFLRRSSTGRSGDYREVNKKRKSKPKHKGKVGKYEFMALRAAQRYRTARWVVAGVTVVLTVTGEDLLPQPSWPPVLRLSHRLTSPSPGTARTPNSGRQGLCSRSVGATVPHLSFCESSAGFRALRARSVATPG